MPQTEVEEQGWADLNCTWSRPPRTPELPEAGEGIGVMWCLPQQLTKFTAGTRTPWVTPQFAGGHTGFPQLLVVTGALVPDWPL